MTRGGWPGVGLRDQVGAEDDCEIANPDEPTLEPAGLLELSGVLGPQRFALSERGAGFGV